VAPVIEWGSGRAPSLASISCMGPRSPSDLMNFACLFVYSYFCLLFRVLVVCKHLVYLWSLQKRVSFSFSLFC
jgi:hypothetical protein